MTFALENLGYNFDSKDSIWRKPNYGGIGYSDGDDNEINIREIIEGAADITVLSVELRRHCTDWPKLYHLSGTRANILRPIEGSICGDVLEIGAGCGAITRYLGECGANVLALEGSPRRAGIARSRTRDLCNVTVVTEKFEDFQCYHKFDVITLIGVLEYANLFTGGENPALAMLRRVHSMLKPEGKLVIAIENQLGLKYFAGAPEDHVGQPMYGIEGRYRNNQPQTFGRKVLAKLLRRAGYLESKFLAPFPDYKLPISIVTEEGIDSRDFDASAFAWQSVQRDRQLPHYCNFSLELAWPEVFKNGLAKDVANSFLIIASPNSGELVRPGTLAYHYSSDRMPEYSKETRFEVSPKGVDVVYKRLGAAGDGYPARVDGVIRFECPANVGYTLGKPLSWEFVQILTRDGWTIEEVGQFLQRYADILEKISGQTVLLSTPGVNLELPGSFFDIIPQNIIIREDGSPEVIDTEWSIRSNIEVAHLMFRALLSMLGSVTRIGHNQAGLRFSRSEFIREALNSAGCSLSENDLARFFEFESAAQEQVTGQSASDYFARWKDQPLTIHNLNYAMVERDAQVVGLRETVAGLNQAMADRDAQVAGLRETVAGLNQAMADRDVMINQLDSARARAEQTKSTLQDVIRRQQRSMLGRIKHRVAMRYWQWRLRQSPLFDADWYRAKNVDVAQASIDPLRHYLLNGWKEGRQPGPEFDGRYYLSRYPDVEALEIPPLAHYWLHGRVEGRNINAAIDALYHAPVADMSRGSLQSPADKGDGLSPDRFELVISVIIPTYNRIKLLPGVLDAWRAVDACTKFPYEIIFSDDGSEDGSFELLEAINDLPIRVLRNQHGGASRARNAAIAAASGQRLLIIGDDIFPDPEILNVHAALGRRLGPEVATLGTVDWHPKLRVNHLMHHITEVGNEQFSYNRLSDGAFTDFRHFYTCNICVPRHFLVEERVLFDERFDEYGFEDIELGYRLSMRGMKIYFTTAASGAHFHPYTTAGFCRRQASAGRMAIVFAGIHPGVKHIIGIPAPGRCGQGDDGLWQRRLDSLVQRCEEYERLISMLPRDVSQGLRRCLSALYSTLFRAMYEYGVLQKLGRCPNPLGTAMSRHFHRLPTGYWDRLSASTSRPVGLSIEETYNLSEALTSGRMDDLLYGHEQRALFEELLPAQSLGANFTEMLGTLSGRGLAHLLVKAFYLLRNDPHHFGAAVRKTISRRMMRRPATPHSTVDASHILAAVPGLVLHPDLRDRDAVIADFRSVFGASLLVYESTGGGMLIPVPNTTSNAIPISPATADATIFFWPKSIQLSRQRDSLLAAYLALLEGGLDIALISHSLCAGPNVLVGELHDHIVFSRNVAQGILNNTLRDVPFSGKILRLLPAKGNESLQEVSSLLGCPVQVDVDGFMRNSLHKQAAPVRYKPPFLPSHQKARPVVFVFPIFLAVGGVERNTIEIMRVLKDRFEFVVITMERLRPEQGSLAAQAMEVAAQLIEMSEIVRHEDYLRVLFRLKANYQPDLVWVCNGSPWFCDNAKAIREIFHDVPVIDQEVYDVERGWISRYAEPGIRSFDDFIAVNRKIEKRFLQDFMIDPAHVHLIYSAVDTARIRRFKSAVPDGVLLRQKFGLPPEKALYTFVARLTPQKQPIEFLKLAKHRLDSDDEFFVLVGDGELAGEAQAFIEKNDLRNVKRIPYIENTLELNAISSGIIFTSAFEGLPIAMLEAIAMGVPCFATDVGDIADVLAEYGGGIVVPVGQADTAIHRAFDHWLEKRDDFSANLRDRENDILERFSSRNIARQYRACWETAMSRYGRTTA